jgi:hypothetical protein
MSRECKATFDVTSWDEQPFDEHDGVAKLTRASVTKKYSGDIAGNSVTAWLMAYADDGSAIFVGLERIDGTVAGQEGTLVLQHVGKYEDGAAKAELTIVAGANSGELAAVAGRGDFVADPSGSVTLELD